MANATPATQPLPENDSRPARPVFFTAKSSAVAHAVRLATQASPIRTYRSVEFVADAFQAVGDGKAFAAESAAPSDDYVVRELPTIELVRRQQAGIRAAVASCLERSRANDLAAGIMKPGSPTRLMHEQRGRLERERARELQRRLTVSGAPCALVKALEAKAADVCICGKIAVVNGLCRGCDEDKFYRRDVPGAKLEGAE